MDVIEDIQQNGLFNCIKIVLIINRFLKLFSFKSQKKSQSFDPAFGI